MVSKKAQQLSIDEVKHIAKLAKLSLTSDEIKKLQKQLSQVLQSFTLLNKVKTDNVSKTSQVIDLKNILRADEPGLSLTVNQVLKNSQHQYKNYFVVPSVFKND